MKLRRNLSIAVIVIIAISLFGCTDKTVETVSTDISSGDTAMLNTVREYLDLMLNTARDPYDGKNGGATPLFANGIEVETGKPMLWTNYDGEEYALSNMATQQNFFRALDAMSIITGDKKYTNATQDAIKYMFKKHTYDTGLLYWGGHVFIDLKTNIPQTPSEQYKFHELKYAFPYYELMAKADRRKTIRLIESFWGSTIIDWSRLEFDRHGFYTKTADDPFNTKYILDFPVLYPTKNLTLLSTGSDLAYAAASAYKITGEKVYFDWSMAQIAQYRKARDPKTGLGVNQYTYYSEAPDTDHPTSGDRAFLQMGQEFGTAAAEPYLLTSGNSVYGKGMLLPLHLSDIAENEKDAEKLIDYASSGLIAYQQYCYDYTRNSFKPVLADGTDLTGISLKRDGYFGEAGKVFGRYKDDGTVLLATVRAHLRSGGQYPDLWRFAKALAKEQGLGDLGSRPGYDTKFNLEKCASENPLHIFTLVELYSKTGEKTYIDLGRKIADNIINNRMVNGYFVKSRDCVFAPVDAIEPLALLTLYQAIAYGKDGVDKLPAYFGGEGYTCGGIMFPDGTKQEIVESKLYSIRRGEYGY